METVLLNTSIGNGTIGKFSLTLEETRDDGCMYFSIELGLSIIDIDKRFANKNRFIVIQSGVSNERSNRTTFTEINCYPIIGGDWLQSRTDKRLIARRVIEYGRDSDVSTLEFVH